MKKLYDKRVRKLTSGNYVCEGLVLNMFLMKTWKGFGYSYFWNIGTVNYFDFAVTSEEEAHKNMKKMTDFFGI